ncbi:hypothetical protein BDN72DRAFT_775687 [Pluteus cervinus]|uniref:Uncharacterized protein n=1 Tax=Pluteus cervinus TaxID=181527 RepID=A0ACD3AD29_9AGAR|nr:hypothetical protein BDN72DRAFT_775687 [Pluteus cervinus]
MRFSAFTLLPLLSLVDVALSLCPGFNYAIGNVQPIGNGINRWTIYDDSCNPVDSLTTDLNPCTTGGIFACSPPPITFVKYTNTFTGLMYACRKDANSGVCGSDIISVCCRNDGH